MAAFAPATFRSMDARGRWCTVTVEPALRGWSVTWTDTAGVFVPGTTEHDRTVRDRIRAALITAGLGDRVPPALVHVEGGSYFDGFDAGVIYAMVAPDRLHDGITGAAGLDGVFRPVTRHLEELNVPVENLAELRPPRIDAIAGARVVRVP
jgi:hypothetical protein